MYSDITLDKNKGVLPNSEITQFPYSNIQGNATIIIYDKNDKNWKSEAVSTKLPYE